MKNLFSFVFVFVMTLLFNTADVLAINAPSSIIVKRAETLEDLVTNQAYGFTLFETTDGQNIYCVDPDKKGLVTGQTAKFSKDGDAGLLYILQNGYPNKQITGNDEIDAYITQAVVWWYMDETGQAGEFSSNFKNATSATDSYNLIPKYIKPMVEKAKQAKDTQVKPSITFTNNGLQLNLSDDENYYESNYMAAALVGASNYTVSVEGAKNVEVMDEKGNLGTTMNSSERFKIRIPVSSVTEVTNVNVKVSATGKVQKAKIYMPSDTSYQRVVGLYDENINVSKGVTLSADPKEPEKHVCEFTDNKYYGKNGNEVDKATFDNECGQEVVVPDTSANIIFGSVGVGVLAIAAGIGIIIYTNYRNKKKNLV